MKYFDQYHVVDLIEDGRNVEVTDLNKREYVETLCKMLMKKSIEKQIESFLKGFYELIPKELIVFFDCSELELLITGQTEINISDMQQNTEYSGYTPQAQTIVWFWQILHCFTHSEKSAFLQFVTGKKSYTNYY